MTRVRRKAASSSDFSDTEGDATTWSSEDETDEVAISSERLVPSLRSAEEVNSKKSVVDDEEESELSNGKADGEYKCNVCGVSCKKPSLLKQHMCSHSKDRSFVCPVEKCGRQYKRQDHLNRHSLTHKGSLFPCPREGCELTFNVNSNLQRHLKVHEKWGSDVLRSRKGNAQLTCPEPGCGRAFKYPSLLQTHIDNVHERLLVCQAVCMEAGCGESFESPSELRAHTKVAHSFAFCETCGVSMLKSSLAAHRKKHESEQVLLRCPHPGCLHSYNKKSNLNAHIRAIHKNLRPYGCPHAGCEKLFAYKSVRDKHAESSIHAERVVGGDFEAEDSEGRRKGRGGRKRARLENVELENVEDLLPREWRRQAPE